jgi:alkylation response protein AidB-like acyl-CoA dehydrogenase
MDEEQRKLAEELLFSEKKQPSFAKQLFFGVVDNIALFPFPEDSKTDIESAAFLENLKKFAEKEIDGNLIDKQSLIPQTVISGLGTLGALGVTIPKKYSGLGLSQRTYCRATEIISRQCGATALFVNAHQSIGLKALLLFGTEKQKERWLPALARGEQLAAFSLTEPNAGSDANGIETRAVYDKDRKIWRINGHKQWTTNGSIASMLTVMARTEIETPEGPQDKITAFIVTPDMAGFQVAAKALDKVGMRGSQTANLEFHDLEVPEENILGPLGGGLKVCLTVLDYGRTTFGATCTGAAKFLVEKAIQHAVQRYQFKRPLGSFSLVKKKIASMSALAYAMESATYLTAGFVDQGMHDFMLESAILKVFASDSLWTILYDTMQIYGGRSFFTDAPFERMMRDARLNMIGEGSNEVMRAFIGAVGLRDVGLQLKNVSEAAKKPFNSFSELSGFAKGWLGKLFAPTLSIKSHQIEQAARSISSDIRSFGIEVTKALITHREAIIEKQLILDRLSNCAMALYSALATLSRVDSAIQANRSTTGHSLDNEIATALLYCKMASSTISTNISTLRNNDDADFERLSDRLTKIRYP